MRTAPSSAFDDQAPDGARHVGRLVELVADLDVVRQDGLEAWQVGFDGLDDRERRGVRPLGHRDVDGAAAVDQRVAGLDVGGVFDRADVADEDVCVPCERIGMSFRSLKSPTTELTGTIGIRSPMRTLPEGLIVLPARQRLHDLVRATCCRRAACRDRRGRRWCAGSRRTAAAPRRPAGSRTTAAP